MTTHSLCFYRDALAPSATIALRGEMNRVLYLRAGSARVQTADHAVALAPDSAWHARCGCSVVAGPAGAEIYRWELVRADTSRVGAAPSLLDASVTLDDGARYLIRCDRVDFPPGGIAYTHTHRGPGIRCLLAGSITIEVNGRAHTVAPGEAWFEAGPDPVLATASASEPTSFARVMILPVELLGQSSIRYVLPEDQDKPKRQTYRLFVDHPIDV